MKIEEYISKWCKAGIITEDQARVMIKDSREIIEGEKKSRIAGVFGVVGAVILGLGILLFIGANWQTIPALIKILLSLGLCGLSAYGAYYFETLGNRPKTAGTLSFLSSIFWGITVVLVSQQYSTGDMSKVHFIILIWLVGMIPGIYLFNSAASASLFSFLVILWANTYLQSYYFDGSLFAIAAAGFILYGIGGIHAFFPNYLRIGRVYRIFGLYTVMFTFLCFSVISYYDFRYAIKDSINNFVLIFFVALLFVFLSAIATKNNITKMIIENLPPGVGILLCLWIIVGVPVGISELDYRYNYKSFSYLPQMIMINIFLVIVCTMVLWIGYRDKNTKLVNAGYFFGSIYLIFKYCEIGWGMLSTSFFFIAGGIMFLIIGYFVEKKRRQIITNIKSIGTENMQL